MAISYFTNHVKLFPWDDFVNKTSVRIFDEDKDAVDFN